MFCFVFGLFSICLCEQGLNPQKNLNQKNITCISPAAADQGSEHDPIRGDFCFHLCSVLKPSLCFSVLPSPGRPHWRLNRLLFIITTGENSSETNPAFFKKEEHQSTHKGQHQCCQSDPLASSSRFFYFYPPGTDSKLASG